MAVDDGSVEAIQVELEGVGIILLPGSPELPPDRINREQISFCRVFEHPNPLGPVFKYKRTEPLEQWRLVEE